MTNTGIEITSRVETMTRLSMNLPLRIPPGRRRDADDDLEEMAMSASLMVVGNRTASSAATELP